MSPEDSRINTIRRLLAELNADRSALANRTSKLQRCLQSTNEYSFEQLSGLALSLDRASTTVEAMLQRISRVIMGSLPTGDDWHREMLSDAALVIRRSIEVAFAALAKRECRR